MPSRSGDVNFVRIDSDLAGLARAYLANRAKDLEKIRSALQRRDYEAIHRIGHNMHGSGQMFGFAELTALGANLQQAAGAGNGGEIARLERCIDDFLLRTRIVEDERAGVASDRTESAEAEPARERCGQYVLVVDDDAMNRMLITHYLKNGGYRVREVSSGEEALAAVKEQPLPALVVLDVVMPGTGGLAVCRRIRSDPATAAIPIVLLTALDKEEDRQRGMEAGANDFVSKPVSRRELMSRVSVLAPCGARRAEETAPDSLPPR